MNDLVKNVIVFVVVGFLLMTVVQTFGAGHGQDHPGSAVFEVPG